jgi:Bacterial Ig-like domain/Concanavalin A-like lectin/glucanases superfamily
MGSVTFARMRKTFRIVSFVFLFSIFSFQGCVKDIVSSGPLTLVSLTLGKSNLNGNEVVDSVAVDLNIVAVFSAPLDPSTIDSTSVTLKRGVFTTKLNFVISGNTLTIDPASTLLSGAKLILFINKSVRSSGGQLYDGKSFSFKTSGVGFDTAPRSESQVLYLSFNGSVSDIAGNAAKIYEKVGYTTDRFGIANFAANFRGATAGPGSGDIVELDGGSKLMSPSMTISYWFGISEGNYVAGNRPILGIAAERGYYFEIGNRASGFNPNSLIVATDHLVASSEGNVNFRSEENVFVGNNVTNDSIPFSSAIPVQILLKDGWHQLVMTFDSETSLKTIYIDGVMIQQWSFKNLKNGITLKGIALNPHKIALADPKLAIGYYCTRENTASLKFNYNTDEYTYVGALDDLRIFNLALTPQEVGTLYTVEKLPQ